MLFNNLILLPLFSHIKNLVSKMFAKFAYSLDIRIFRGFFLTLLAT
ncbi:hypothetical protein SAMN05660405_00572 [Psychrobacter pacificensis]|uniref:Uncharacterized protein n=1 Tax=Psychrobacter pacificensis TaxID=112002 RepID=A0A1G6VGP0_9GAMM|nr:hypothetical protein SAMN05660405_00572 [Psychrobacter pacificensis]